MLSKAKPYFQYIINILFFYTIDTVQLRGDTGYVVQDGISGQTKIFLCIKLSIDMIYVYSQRSKFTQLYCYSILSVLKNYDCRDRSPRDFPIRDFEYFLLLK